MERLSDEHIDMMVNSSFKNFHVKGFDYLCLFRSPLLTQKVYFFNGDVAQLPEVINPHDHRYDFKTTVLSGHMSNSHYTLDEQYGDTYQEFEWNTPLNGGDGFHWKRETKLRETVRHFYTSGSEYRMKADEFHTIRMHKEGTVIMLNQFDDVVPIGQPTRTFMGDKKAPELNGLYECFTPDEVIKRFHEAEILIKRCRKA